MRFRLAVYFNVSGAVWTGGELYLRNLLVALHALPETSRPEIALVLPPGMAEPPESLRPLVDSFLPMPPPDPERWPNFWERQALRVRQRLGLWKEPVPAEPPLSRCLRERGVQALFSNTEFGPCLRVPLATWIPDFQHHHLPEMFPESERTAVDGYRRDMARNAALIVLSSEDARRDFVKFVPFAAGKARVVSFVAQVPVEVYDRDPAWVCRRYSIPETFFYLPNQFWKHKNHDIVIRALALIKARGQDVTVVCTGNTNDHRDHAFMGGLLERISVQGVRDRMVVLGLVPREALHALMRQSVAVLQPSLFEGWSTTVEEAKSLGKAIVLSNISVHREQNPPAAVYFDPHDPAALAECMTRVWAERQPGPDAAMEAAARLALPARMRDFAEQFMRVASEARRGDGTPKRSAPDAEMIR